MVLKDHLEKLHYFFEVAKAGTFKEAALRINITQPSLTKSIQVLEGALDKKLFVRQPRGVVLTPEGELLLNYCHQLFGQISDLEIKLNSPDDPMAGSIRVGTYDSIGIYFWPKFLRKFLPRYPKLSLEFNTGRSQVIQAQVEKGELDLGLIIEPIEGINTQVIELGKDHFKLYSTDKVKPNYESFEKAPVIYMPEALAGAENLFLKKWLPKLNSEEERIEYRTSSLEASKALIVNGIGIGLLPTRVAEEDFSKGRIKEIELKGFPKKGIGEHRIGLVYSKYREHSVTMQRLIEALKSEAF